MTIHIYKASDGYRWRMIAHNGFIVADGAEAYTKRYSCKKAANNIVQAIILEGVRVTYGDESK